MYIRLICKNLHFKINDSKQISEETFVYLHTSHQISVEVVENIEFYSLM